VREVVDYARRRGVTVVPEIEMPGHASAAVASYPSLGCADSAITVPNSWGVFPHVLCVERPAVDSFISDVLDDVAELFPSRYVHLGGDEALNIPDSVQAAFTRRMAAALERRGRRLIGWDEITEGGLPPGVVVQVWRGMEYADSAAARGNDVIASPESYTYLNRSPAELPLDSVYAFDPGPRPMGGEVTFWSEHIDGANLDFMAFPRVLAFAEAMWSRAPRDYPGFKRRLDGDHYARLRAAGVRAGPENRPVGRLGIRVDPARGSARVVAEINAPGVVARVMTDGSDPMMLAPLLDTTRAFDSGTVRVRLFNVDRPMLVERRLEFARHAARGKPVELSRPPRPRYPGTGPANATDGLLGSDDFDDGLWQGWLADFAVTIDLGESQPLREFTGSFLQNTRSWILMPAAIAVDVSSDGTIWHSAGSASRPLVAERLEPHRDRITVALGQPITARYVRVSITTGGPLTAWHGGAGNPSWVFMDEMIVR
jgi:hexosaminidase